MSTVIKKEEKSWAEKNLTMEQAKNIGTKINNAYVESGAQDQVNKAA